MPNKEITSTVVFQAFETVVGANVEFIKASVAFIDAKADTNDFDFLNIGFSNGLSVCLGTDSARSSIRLADQADAFEGSFTEQNVLFELKWVNLCDEYSAFKPLFNKTLRSVDLLYLNHEQDDSLKSLNGLILRFDDHQSLCYYECGDTGKCMVNKLPNNELPFFFEIVSFSI